MTLLMRERERYNEGREVGRREGREEGTVFGMIKFALDMEREQAEDYLMRFQEGSL